MTNSCTSKMAKGTEAQCYSSQSTANSQRYHSRVVKSSVYNKSSVTPIRIKHRQSEPGECVKNTRVKPVEKVIHNSSPTTVRQGTTNAKHRASPSKEGSPRSSPTFGTFYAGAKFSEPPSPTALPKPPSHWTATLYMSSSGALPLFLSSRVDKCHEISHLKMLLNVPA